MSSDEQSLSIALLAQKKRDLAPNVSSQVIAEIKGSQIFQYDWRKLLQSAPTAINVMGSCFIAASSPTVAVKLDAPRNKPFEYLSNDSLQANLVELANLGRFAFIEAEGSMGIIRQTSLVINGKLNDVVESLGDPPSAKKLLKPQLATIQKGATACHEAAVKMDKKFSYWLAYCCELHTAAENQSATTTERQWTNEVNLAAETAKRDYTQQAVDSAKAATDLLSKQVTMASEAFKKASDDYPSGWDVLAQQIVGDLVGCVTQAFSTAIPAFTGMLGGGDSDQTAGGSSSQGSAGTATNPLPKQATDPAYVEILKSITFLRGLDSILFGQDGNINWEQAKARGDSNGATSSLDFLGKMLNDAKQTFATVATNTDPSKTLSTILDVGAQTANAIIAEVAKSKGLIDQLPAKDSPQVAKWQNDIRNQLLKAVELEGTAKSMPGTAAGGIPLMTDKEQTVQPEQVDAKSPQAQTILGAAQARLSITQAALTSSQENFVKASSNLTEQQAKLGEIAANLAKLAASKITLAEVKKILLQCIALLLTLKECITNLVSFFQSLANIVGVCVNLQVEPFLETIKALVAADGADPNQSIVIGSFTLTDLQRSQVYSAVLTLKAYFSIFGDIAKMWTTLSIENIMPGLKMCDELSVTNNDATAMQRKVKDLQTWSENATKKIETIAAQNQAEILDGMQGRIDSISETTRLLPPSPSTAKAIKAGTSVTRDAAQASIAQQQADSPFSRFAIAD